MLVDVDDTIIEVHGHAKQGSGYGYTKVRGLNAQLATVSTPGSAPVIVAQRLRKGSAGSARGAKRLVADALKTVTTMTGGDSSKLLLRADSAYYGSDMVRAALRAGADVSVTVRLTAKVKAAIATIADNAWTTIEYPDAVYDESSGTWIPRAEVAEVPFTAFSSKKAATGYPAGWSCDASPTSIPAARTLRTPCSTPGASTPSSPPPTPTTWTRSPRTRPTAATPSSNKCTPT